MTSPTLSEALPKPVRDMLDETERRIEIIRAANARDDSAIHDIRDWIATKNEEIRELVDRMVSRNKEMLLLEENIDLIGAVASAFLKDVADSDEMRPQEKLLAEGWVVEERQQLDPMDWVELASDRPEATELSKIMTAKDAVIEVLSSANEPLSRREIQTAHSYLANVSLNLISVTLHNLRKEGGVDSMGNGKWYLVVNPQHGSAPNGAADSEQPTAG